MGSKELREFIELVPDAVIVTDGAGRIIEANQQAVTMTGYGRDELAGLGVDALVPDRVQGRHPALRDRFMASPHVRPMGAVGDLTLRRRDGQEVPVDIRLSYLGDADGRLIIAAVRDMTAARAAERRLRASEQRFRSLTELSSDWYWEQDRDLRFTVVSGASHEKTGFRTNDLIGKTRFDLPNHFESEEARLAHAADLEARRPFRELILKRETGSGETRWASISGEPVYAESGEFEGYRGIGQDITDKVLADQRLAEEQRFSEDLLNAVPSPIVVKDASHRFIAANDAAVRFSRRPKGQVIGRTDYDIFPPEQAAYFQQTDDLALANGSIEYEHPYTRDGLTRWMYVRKSVLRRGGGVPQIVFVMTDMTERMEAEQALKESEARFRSLTELSSDWFWEQDDQFRFTRFSSTAPERAVVPVEQMIGKTRFELPLEFESEQAREDHLRALQAHVPFRNLVVLNTLNNRWVSANGEPVLDAQGGFKGYRGVATDITERKQAEERTQFLATRDALTGLPNRALLQERMQVAMINAARNAEKVAVMFIDMDRFKDINDLLGHEVGDRFLKEAAARLSECVRKGDTLARIGGDEFVIVLEGLHQVGDAELVAAKAVARMAEPFAAEGSVMTSGASIGVAVTPDDGMDVSTLMRHADMAMYQAKADGRSCYRFYSTEINKKVNRRVQLESELRRALEREELVLYLQPQLSVATGVLVGAEVLLRWPHRERGMIPPQEFIAVAEESGLIVPIGEYVLDGVGNLMRNWIRAGMTVPRIAVNLSAWQVEEGAALVEKLRSVLRSGGLKAEMLEFEITESLIVAEEDRRKLMAIRELAEEGVRISIDDFGVGYSSLSYLRYLPIHGIKVDRSFISDISTSPDAAAIVRAMLALAHSLGLSVTAEGVEQAVQLDVLKQFGCDLFQGYLVSPAIPPDEFATRFLSVPACIAAPSSGWRNRNQAATEI